MDINHTDVYTVDTRLPTAALILSSDTVSGELQLK